MATTKNLSTGSSVTFDHAPRSVRSPLIIPPQDGIQSMTEKSMPRVEAQAGSAV
jgi:hypothetical protein